MRLFYYKRVMGKVRLMDSYTLEGDQGEIIITTVGGGNQFWAFEDAPLGKVVAVTFTGAPVCTADAVQNNALIDAINVAPLDVLTYE